MTQKGLLKIWDVDFDKIVVSKSFETKKGFKHLVGYSEDAIRPLVLIMPRMSGYVKTFKKNQLMSHRIDDDKLLGKYKTI